MTPLQDLRVVSLAVNVPGPVAVARLRELGAGVVKIEPPEGDPLAQACPAWYGVLCHGQEVRRLNLKDPADRATLERLLAASDLLLTATRPAALARLALGWPELHERWPRLCHVAMVGYPAPDHNLPGHDLTYLAGLGLLAPPRLPRTLMADLAAAEQAASAALALLLERERGGEAGYAEVSIARAAAEMAQPWRYGLTREDGPLGGALPGYNLYRAQEGWVAVAALEPHFWEVLQSEFGLSEARHADLEPIFLTRSAHDWEAWAVKRDLPIAALRDAPASEEYLP